MKKHLLSLVVMLIMFSCSNNETIEVAQQQEMLTKNEINSIIKNSLESSGDFKWTNQEVHTVWSAVRHGEGILTIGYGASKSNFARNAEANIIKNELIQLVHTLEKTSAKGKTELYINDAINVIDVKVKNKETIAKLLNDDRVRYIEPSGYSFITKNENARSDSFDSLSSGCGFREDEISNSDFRTITPGAMVPWAFDLHNIPQAWEHSTGNNVTVAIIDTGMSSEQEYMNQKFNNGFSSGRTIQKKGTFVDSFWFWSTQVDGPNDTCGHGTRMAAVATAPRNKANLPVGVAYNANLVSYRAVENVVIDSYHEQKGVADALIDAANDTNVDIISMSLGNPFYIGRVADAVKYAYSKGKLIFAAGGTSTVLTTWYGVIFPANMDEIVAVTGVKEGVYDNCNVCHDGNEIEFTIQMQRTNGTENKIPVLSYYNNKARYEGGSSIATATTAGIAALVWSKNPSWSREQVIQKMREASEFYPNKNSKYGYGNIDALKAVQ